MTIAILPARLANQIAAGEVVERPASVIKELIENSLDAGATAIDIDVDKGGIKKIKITDNGHGIAKDELTLALSRHATSKIKSLNDLEAINSLGFRGEALASISSVARLTLTSKPKEQATAWQAIAEGRDMSVNIKPAAHPDGTSIEVLDLFFNTPARRKFLRTEKTEFNHIDEVVRRIALAHFEVSFTLTHNGNTVRQYRIANTQAQGTKRVAMICGTKFIEHAVEIDCLHDNMTLSGWLAKPSFSRSQNDLCYSYVNGRMMRDKLINHAIRQAYADLLPADTHPAFVLFLQLDHREVDVNVHPSKHEVRFHQSRYVHDFIYSVCHKALTSALTEEGVLTTDDEMTLVPEQSYANTSNEVATQQALSNNQPTQNYLRADYITPLQHVSDVSARQSNYHYNENNQQHNQKINSHNNSAEASENYQSLMTPLADIEKNRLTATEVVTNNTQAPHFINQQSVANSTASSASIDNLSGAITLLSIQQPGYALYQANRSVRVLSLFNLAKCTYAKLVEQSWHSQQTKIDSSIVGLVSQPLLLPVMIKLSVQQLNVALTEQLLLTKAGIIFVEHSKNRIQIREFPALLREQDVNQAVITILDTLINTLALKEGEALNQVDIYHSIAAAMVLTKYDEDQADILLKLSTKLFNEQLSRQLTLNSIPLDLTSHVNKLNSLT